MRITMLCGEIAEICFLIDNTTDNLYLKPPAIVNIAHLIYKLQASLKWWYILNNLMNVL